MFNWLHKLYNYFFPPVTIIIPVVETKTKSFVGFDSLIKVVNISNSIKKLPHTTRRSSRWKTVRAAHLRKEKLCAACGSSTNLDVHHIVPVHIDPTKELDPDNLISLCENGGNCHLMFGHLKDWKSYNPHVRKMSAQMLELIRNRPYS